MTDIRQHTKDQEPLGIVISRGSREESAPRFWAYVYGDEPDTPVAPRDVKAA